MGGIVGGGAPKAPKAPAPEPVKTEDRDKSDMDKARRNPTTGGRKKKPTLLDTTAGTKTLLGE